ncbi:MAG: hypothetical protein WDO73_04210 [Ignavibacteriota bacterium]
MGRRIRLKGNIALLLQLLGDLDGPSLQLLCGLRRAAGGHSIRPRRHRPCRPHHRHGIPLRRKHGEIQSILRVPAGYGKVAVLEELRTRAPISHHRITYVGDGSSDVHVMLHVNRLGGLTIAVSENTYINQIAKRTVLSDDRLSVLVPVMESGHGMEFRSHSRILRAPWLRVARVG